MSDIVWGVCSKYRTATVFCMKCRKVFNLHAPMVEALELKMAAEAGHECAKDNQTTRPGSPGHLIDGCIAFHP